MILLSKRFSLMTVSKCSPTTPQQHATAVWALPFSLATTWGIIIIFFSSRYLDVSVPWVGYLSVDAPSVHRVVPFGDPGIYCLCAAPPGLSQLTTSFFASQTLGIHHTPLFALKILQILFFIGLTLYITTLGITTFYFPICQRTFTPSFHLSYC